MTVSGLDLKNEVIRIAQENPDFIYDIGVGEQCVYIKDGKGSCLIGRALFNLGLIDASFEKSDRNDDGFDFVAETLDLDIDRETLDFLERVQHRQDRGWTWGSAVDDARVPFLEPLS